MTVAMVVLGCAEDTPKSRDAPAAVVGEEPAVKRHISQADLEAGKFTLDELAEHGRDIFMAPFNTLDGAGRPEQTGKGGQRRRRVMPDNFKRISAPDVNACMACHNLPAIGGGGDNTVKRVPTLRFPTVRRLRRRSGGERTQRHAQDRR